MTADLETEWISINHSVRIPRAELQFRFARSGGPGGQHVNKSETQVELLFDVTHSPSLTEEQRQRVLAKLGNSLDKSGILHIVSASTRSQLQNRMDAVARFQMVLAQALYVPRKRRPTQPTAESRERRLTQKRRRSEIKQGRGKVDLGE